MKKLVYAVLLAASFAGIAEGKESQRVTFETAIPGAALALVQDQKPEWGKTLEDIIDVVHTLHHIKRVIFLDHYECGAYKLMRGADHLASKDTDVAEHKAVFQQARARMKERFPELEVYTMIMDLDGNVQNIS